MIFLKLMALYLDARNEVPHAYSSHEKVKQIFKLQKTTSLPEGLKRMASWALQTGSKSSAPFRGIEINEKLSPL